MTHPFGTSVDPLFGGQMPGQAVLPRLPFVAHAAAHRHGQWRRLAGGILAAIGLRRSTRGGHSMWHARPKV